MKEFKSVKLTQTAPFVKRYITITLVIFLILTALLFLPWQQTVKGVGEVIALKPSQRAYDVVAPMDGFLEEIYVVDNQKVKKGDRLFKMVNLDKNLSSRYNKTKLNLIRQIDYQKIKISNTISQKESIKSISLKKIETLRVKLTDTNNLLSALKIKKRAILNRVYIERENFLRKKSLFKDGVVSKRDLELSKQSFLEALAKKKELLATIKNYKNLIKRLNLEIEKEKEDLKQNLLKLDLSLLDLKKGLKELNNLLQKLNHQIASYKSRVIFAKSDGEVVRIFQNDKNRYLKKGQKVLFFAPKSTQYALRVKVSEFNMPLIHKGYEARVMFYGWPSIYISGWPKISYGTYGAKVAFVDGLKFEQNYYYAILTPVGKWPPKELLKIGTEATVWIKLEFVPIWYEIWRILLGQPPKLPRSVKDEI